MPSRHDKTFYFFLGAREAAIATATTYLADLFFNFFALATIMGLLNFFHEKGVFEDNHTLKEIHNIIVTCIIYITISIIFTLILIVGIVKNRSKMMLPWLTGTAIGIVGSMLFLFICFMLPDTEAQKFGFLAALIVFAHTIYKWEVVKYCYYQIKNEEIASLARGPLPNQNNEAPL